ncbi:MAG: hypothetical protein HYW52_12030 [Gemmatimonadetes bacterium]|nr:hypothetical protein [Gemmatimonadota bacterium]
MFWVIGFLVLLVALLIPILAIVLDAPAMRHLLERRFGAENSRDLKELTGKVTRLEDDLDDLSRSVQALREETQFLQQLLENPEQRPAPKSLTPPKS